MPPTTSSGFACSTCGRQYQHSNHLRRHEATHLKSEEFKCPHCGRGFKRRDVWRKHYTSCASNNSHDEPPPAKRGKKPRACDACFRSKVSCNGSPACARCKARNIECTYSRVHLTVRSATFPSPNITNAITASPSTVSTPSAASTFTAKEDNTKIPVSFLLGLTNPAAESMVRVFLEEPVRDDEVPIPEPQPDSDNPLDLTLDLPSSDALFFPWVFTDPTSPDPFADLSSFPLPSPSSSSPAEPIDPILQPIVTALSTLHTHLTATDPSYTATFDEGLAAQVFTRSNRATFVANYFRYTHKHLPLLHRPTFGVASSAPALVLVAFLCGALYAPPRDCVLAIPRFFCIAEEFVFRRLDGLLPPEGRGGQGQGQGVKGEWEDREAERELYETLQAAVLIHGAQFIMNTRSAAARRRGWMVRKPALVDAVRRLGLTRARHGERGWEGWVRDEMKIRIAAWTLLTDWQEGGVLHRPGLMTMHEMRGELPGLQELWEANDAAEFEAVIVARGQDCWTRSACLPDCMEALMADPWSGIDGFPLKNLAMHDLYIMVTALHVMIGISQLVSLLQTTMPALQRATERWDELWRAVVGQLDEEEVRRSGFVRHCGEFCWLAKAMVEYARAGKDKTCPYYLKMGHDTPKELHDLLRELRELYCGL